jgi:hypothetical protein
MPKPHASSHKHKRGCVSTGNLKECGRRFLRWSRRGREVPLGKRHLLGAWAHLGVHAENLVQVCGDLDVIIREVCDPGTIPDDGIGKDTGQLPEFDGDFRFRKCHRLRFIRTDK